MRIASSIRESLLLEFNCRKKSAYIPGLWSWMKTKQFCSSWTKVFPICQQKGAGQSLRRPRCDLYRCDQILIIFVEGKSALLALSFESWWKISPTWNRTPSSWRKSFFFWRKTSVLLTAVCFPFKVTVVQQPLKVVRISLSLLWLMLNIYFFLIEVKSNLSRCS